MGHSLAGNQCRNLFFLHILRPVLLPLPATSSIHSGYAAPHSESTDGMLTLRFSSENGSRVDPEDRQSLDAFHDCLSAFQRLLHIEDSPAFPFFFCRVLFLSVTFDPSLIPTPTCLPQLSCPLYSPSSFALSLSMLLATEIYEF